MNLSVRSDYDLRTWHFAGVGDWQMSLENVGKFLSPGMQMSEACKVRRTFQQKKKGLDRNLGQDLVWICSITTVAYQSAMQVRV